MSATDLSVAMIVRLMDQFSGPGARLRDSMRSLKTEANAFRASLGRNIRTGFSAENIEAGIRRSEERFTRARQRMIGAAGMALTLAAPVMTAGNFEEELIHFANLAGLSAERTSSLRHELSELRHVTGQSELQLLEGLATYVGKGMGMDEAMASLRGTGRAATATRSQFEQMANAGYAVMDNLNVAPDRLSQAFDIMAQSGKEGSFELAAMARKFPEITAGARSLGMEGVGAVASLSAALQLAMKSAGSEDQAATNMTNFLGKITAPDTVRKFQEAGVDIQRELAIALERGTDPLEHMLLVIERMTGGDAFKMGELFADKQVLDFLRAVIPNLEEYQRITAVAAGAEGVIDKDYAAVMEGFNESTRQLRNSLTSLLGASGALLPVFTEMIQDATWIVDQVAAWTQANPELTATIVKGAAALLALGIATRVVGLGVAVMQGGLWRTASLLRGTALGARGLARILGRGFKFGGWAIRPLRWTARLIPAIPWRSLVRPLVWGARLIPSIGWASMISRLGTFGMNASGWGRLITPLRWFGRGALRLIPVIGWAVMAAEIGMFAWNYLGLKELPWRDYLNTTIDWVGWFFSFEWLDFLPDWSWMAIIGGPIAWGAMFAFQWADLLPDWDWGAIIPDLGAWFRSSETGNSGTSTNLNGPNAGGLNLRSPAEIQSLSGRVRAGMDMSSDDANSELRSALQNYGSTQPNVTVESRFESNPEINVKIDMPVSITRQQRVDNNAIARATGDQAARATRRALDDAAIAED
ncbi:phage tail tape measure protein [Halocynthiibacter styelae]|uniref:Phage tail tape measure protein n=1 Tax=Halocynthiibacter styelae TaxID=2761955 RepID=A0A8J7IL76_9RHOB|nr:phage tail tape measure protein [Paenihalocynthiibacter styelae]MBI1495413.1 phage tail tape measure protein [Paenihalocynthiibacter styelae]